MADLITNIDTSDSVFKSAGVYVRENFYEYKSPEYVDKELLFAVITDLNNIIDELKVRIHKLENPDISKIRKEKIEKIFTDEEDNQ
jgi:hypothetical protein